MAIAARAAHSLGGHLELESAPGKGSEFRLIIPAHLNVQKGRMSEPAAR